jgi:putative membrane protein
MTQSVAGSPIGTRLTFSDVRVEMGLLAALIVFAPRPLYWVHFASTAAWGMSPLTDQQLAGLLMWVPATLPYLGVGVWLAWSSLRPVEPVA